MIGYADTLVTSWPDAVVVVVAILAVAWVITKWLD